MLESFSIVFAASPRAAHPKMVELCDRTAHVSSHYAFTEDGNLKCPHPPILLMEIIGWIGGWLLVGYGVGGHLTHDVLR